MKSGVFDNRIGTVLPCRNKIMRFILEKVWYFIQAILEKV